MAARGAVGGPPVTGAARTCGAEATVDRMFDITAAIAARTWKRLWVARRYSGMPAARLAVALAATLAATLVVARVVARVVAAMCTAEAAAVIDQQQGTGRRCDSAELHVVKFLLTRPVVQRSAKDRDLHGAQSAHLLAEMTVA